MADVLFKDNSGSLLFECPGCGNLHVVYPEGMPGFGPRWHWNGDMVNPTFSPSLLVKWDQWDPSATDPEVRAKIKAGEIVQHRVHKVCHSFVREGQIQFLQDCTHELAGKTVRIPDWS